MSLIIEKLKHVGNTRASHGLPEAETAQNMNGPDASFKIGSGTVAMPRGLFVSLLLASGIGLGLAVTMAVSNTVSRKNLSQDVGKLLKIQNANIQELAKKVSTLESRQKKIFQNVDERFTTVNAKMIKADEQAEDLTDAVDRIKEDIRNTKLLTENMRDRYANLSSELKTLKLLTVKETAATIVPERKGYGENH